MSDHRSYLMDINIESYFNDQFSLWNQVNRTILNPSRQSHRTIFYEELKDQMNIYNVEESLANPSTLSYQQIEHIDNVVTTMLNQARKKVEGMKRNISYSQEKAKRSGTMLFWKSKIRQLKGKPVDTDAMNRRMTMHNIFVPDEITIEIAKQYLKTSQKQWDELK